MNVKKLSKTQLQKRLKALYEWASAIDRIFSHDALQEAIGRMTDEVYIGKYPAEQLVGAMRFFNYFKMAAVKKANTEYMEKLEDAFHDTRRWNLIEGRWHAPFEIPDDPKEVKE